MTRPYARRLLERGYDARKLLKNLGKDTRLFGGYMRLAPRFVYDILRRTAQGRHRLEVRHTGIEGMDLKFEKGVNRFTLGLVISASLIAAAPGRSLQPHSDSI